MKIRPHVLYDRPSARPPRVSLILLDWSCRESFHIFDYLARQDVPRDWFEVVWIEYYDRAGRLLKVVTNTDLRRYGKYRRWTVTQVHDVTRNHRTVLTVTDRKIDRGLGDEHFSAAQLERGYVSSLEAGLRAGAVDLHEAFAHGVIPHAVGEGRTVFPVLRRVTGTDRQATEMTHEHRELGEYEVPVHLSRDHVVPVKLWVAPPTKMDQSELIKEGHYAAFGTAGARTEMPGCSLCMGNQAQVREGATVVSTSTRNFPNRLGKNTNVYLGSAELAAICSKLGRIPTKDEYMADMGVINKSGDQIYQYLNFDKIADYKDVADVIEV